MKLSIIILNYNTKDLTLRCLKSIQDRYKKQLEDGEFEVVVVDNASEEEFKVPASMQGGQSSKFKVIRNEKNEGFSKGNNIGASAAKGKYLLFLNSDTEIQDRGLLGMVEYLDKNENVGILGAKLANPDGSAQRSCGKFYNLQNTLLMLAGRQKLIRFSPSTIKEVDWVSGAALMIKGELFNKLHGFDENIFMYMEDMELCFRVKKEKYKIYFYPDIKILHKELGSSNRTFAIVNIYKNLLYFYSKHKSYPEYLLVKSFLYSKAIMALTIGIVTHNNYLTTTYKKAMKL